MANKKQWNWNTVILLTVILLASDLGTKFLAKNFLQTPVRILSGILELRVSFNTGVAFSIPIPNLAMLILGPILIGILVWLASKYCDLAEPLTKIVLSLFVAGASGNLLNRIWTGSVIDFIDFSFWPSFNLADSYLTAATFLIIIFYGKISLTK